MIQGLVIAHSDFGAALQNAVESISGDTDNIVHLSNTGLSTDRLTENIRSVCEKSDHDSVIIFVDVYGGSCWRASKKARIPNAHIITGFNLPMLLSFINKRDSLPFDELAHTLEVDGKRGIKSE